MGIIWLHQFGLANRTRVRNRWRCRWCGLEVLQERVKVTQWSDPDLPPTPRETGKCKSGEGYVPDEVIVVERRKGRPV